MIEVTMVNGLTVLINPLLVVRMWTETEDERAGQTAIMYVGGVVDHTEVPLEKLLKVFQKSIMKVDG